MQFDRVIKGGNVVTPAGTFVGDVGIKGEKIAALGVDLDSDKSTKVIDASPRDPGRARRARSPRASSQGRGVGR